MGALPSSVAITLDVLDAANRISRGTSSSFSVRLLSAQRTRRTSLGNGAMAIACEHAARQQLDLVIVPGLGISTEAEFIARLMSREARAAMDFLKAQARRGAR